MKNKRTRIPKQKIRKRIKQKKGTRRRKPKPKTWIDKSNYPTKTESKLSKTFY